MYQGRMMAFEILEKLYREIRATSVPFLLVHIPSVAQVYPHDWVSSFYIKHNNVQLDLPSQILTEFAKKHSIPFLDLVQPFRRNSSRVYFPHGVDNHINEDGHLVTGQVLTKYIVENVFRSRRNRI